MAMFLALGLRRSVHRLDLAEQIGPELALSALALDVPHLLARAVALADEHLRRDPHLRARRAVRDLHDVLAVVARRHRAGGGHRAAAAGGRVRLRADLL